MGITERGHDLFEFGFGVGMASELVVHHRQTPLTNVFMNFA